MAQQPSSAETVRAEEDRSNPVLLSLEAHAPILERPCTQRPRTDRHALPWEQLSVDPDRVLRTSQPQVLAEHPDVLSVSLPRASQLHRQQVAGRRARHTVR